MCGPKAVLRDSLGHSTASMTRFVSLLKFIFRGEGEVARAKVGYEGMGW